MFQRRACLSNTCFNDTWFFFMFVLLTSTTPRSFYFSEYESLTAEVKKPKEWNGSWLAPFLGCHSLRNLPPKMPNCVWSSVTHSAPTINASLPASRKSHHSGLWLRSSVVSVLHSLTTIMRAPLSSLVILFLTPPLPPGLCLRPGRHDDLAATLLACVVGGTPPPSLFCDFAVWLPFGGHSWMADGF